MRSRHAFATYLGCCAALVRAGAAVAQVAGNASADPGPPTVRFATSAELRCPPAKLLGEVLRAELGATVDVRAGEPSRGETGIYLGPGPRGRIAVWIWEEGAAPPKVRELGGTGESCRDLADAVALLASTLLRRGALAIAGAELPRAAEPVLAPAAPAGAVLAPRAALVITPTPAELPVPAAPAEREALPWRLSLGGAWLIGLDSAASVGLGSAAAELALGRRLGVGAGGELALETVQNDAQVAGGRLLLQRQFAGVWLTFRPLSGALPDWILRAGPLLEHLAGSGRGYPAAVTQDFLALGGTLATRYDVALLGPLGAFGELGVRALPQSLYFYALAPDGTQRRLFTEPQVSLTAGFGLAVQLR